MTAGPKIPNKNVRAFSLVTPRRRKKRKQTWIVAKKSDFWRDANAGIHQEEEEEEDAVRADGAVIRSE